MKAHTDVDWSSMATILVDLDAVPRIVIDRQLSVRLFNGACEKLFRVDRSVVIGRSFAEIAASLEEPRSVRYFLEEALRGVKRACETRTALADGRRLILQWEFASVGSSSAPAVLASVRSCREDVSTAPPTFEGDLHYEIETAPGHFGVIRQAWTGDRERDSLLPGTYCFQKVRGGAGVCGRCPAVQLRQQEVRTTVVRLNDDRSKFSIVRALGLTESTARISVRQVDEQVLNDVLDVKVNELAERGKLSPRERELLHHFVAGRTIEELSELLKISPRTVKFHQANVLAKLGADSRIDLFRLIL